MFVSEETMFISCRQQQDSVKYNKTLFWPSVEEEDYDYAYIMYRIDKQIHYYFFLLNDNKRWFLHEKRFRSFTFNCGRIIFAVLSIPVGKFI